MASKKKESVEKKVRTHKRQYGGGTLKLRGSIWLAEWRDKEGARHSRSTGETDKDKAELKLREFASEARTASIEAAAARAVIQYKGRLEEEKAFQDKTPALEIEKAWQAYLDNMERPDTGAETLKMYAVQFGRFVTWLHGHDEEIKSDIDDKAITVKHVKGFNEKMIELRQVDDVTACAFAKYIAETRSANTYNKYIGLFRHIWTILKNDAKLTSNPWEKIHKKKENPHSRRELTIEELQRVISLTEGEMRVLFAIGIYTGLRLGDAVNLTWGNVDLVRRLILRKTIKTGADVAIPIHASLASVLSCLDHCTGPITPKLSAQYKRNKRWLITKIQRIFIAAGIETQSEVEGNSRKGVDVGFHSLRHSFVSLCANNKVPIALVQSIVGHTSTAMTQHYFHASVDALRGAVEVLPTIGKVAEIEGAEENESATMKAFKEAVMNLKPEEKDGAFKWFEEQMKTDIVPN